MDPKLREAIIQDMKSMLPRQLSKEERERVLQQWIDNCFSGPNNHPGEEDEVGAPLIEIHSVTIHPNGPVDDKEPLNIYGSIQVINGRGDVFDIYNQPEDDPDQCYFGDELHLLDEDPIMSPFPVTHMKFLLTDKITGLRLIDETLSLDYTKEKISIVKIENHCVRGKHGSVNVNFTTFEAAVITCLDLTLFKKDDHSSDNESDWLHLTADITASYECKYSFGQHSPATLVSAGQDDPLKVKCGTSIPLYKSALAVPVYSSLKIQAKLGDIVSGHRILFATPIGFQAGNIDGSAGYFLQVLAEWKPGNPEKEMERSGAFSNSVDNSDSPHTFCIYRRPIECEFEPVPAMEVFSITVIPDAKPNQGNLHLYGEIVVHSHYGNFSIFKRDKDFPQEVSCGEGKILMVKGPDRQCFEATCTVSVKVDLKDVDVEDVLFKGFICWRSLTLDRPTFSWYNRRLCSVIPADSGLVKVHYSIFSGTVRASLNVLFSFDSLSLGKVRVLVTGSIVARYGIYDYTTSYDQEYYQSVLFSESSPLELTNGRKISLPLLKSVVPVPKRSCLIVEVDLCTSLGDDTPDKKALRGVVELQMGTESCWRVTNKEFFVDVLVDWG